MEQQRLAQEIYMQQQGNNLAADRERQLQAEAQHALALQQRALQLEHQARMEELERQTQLLQQQAFTHQVQQQQQLAQGQQLHQQHMAQQFQQQPVHPAVIQTGSPGETLASALAFNPPDTFHTVAEAPIPEDHSSEEGEYIFRQ